ncbi:MAG TPA: hypothetical protein VI685_11690 [Candidatus Angelobacter sp.]
MASLAVNLLWLSVALDAIRTFLLWLDIKSDPHRSIVIPVVAWVIGALLVSKIAAGRSWARIVFLILVVLEVASIFVVPDMSTLMFANSNVQGILNIATPVLDAVGITMLFMPNAAAEFGR